MYTFYYYNVYTLKFSIAAIHRILFICAYTYWCTHTHTYIHALKPTAYIPHIENDLKFECKVHLITRC